MEINARLDRPGYLEDYFSDRFQRISRYIYKPSYDFSIQILIVDLNALGVICLKRDPPFLSGTSYVIFLYIPLYPEANPTSLSATSTNNPTASLVSTELKPLAMRFSSPLLPLLFLGSVAASAPRLYSDTVSYCSTSRAVIIDSFDISYWRSNQSVTFDFSLASVRSNLNASVNLYVNVYGRQAVDTTINLCGLLDGLLCPLPQINYTGMSSVLN